MAEVKHPQFKGAPKTRQQKRSKERRGNVDTSKMNDGGYYEGMPGVHIDENGNREMLSFIVTPEGYGTAMIYAHPKLTKITISGAMESNKMVKEIIKSSVLETLMTDKSILNWFIKFSLSRQFKRSVRKQEKLNEQLENEMD